MHKEMTSPISPENLTDKELAHFAERFMMERGYLPLAFQSELVKRFVSRV